MNKVPHPCVRPRRRFVLAFLGVCMLLVLVDFARIGTFKLDFYGVFLVEVLLLALPSRTSHGTLMQLVGLVMPFSAVVILVLYGIERCFPSPEKVPWTELIMIPFGLVSVAGLFFYPLGFWLVCRWCRAENRGKIQK